MIEFCGIQRPLCKEPILDVTYFKYCSVDLQRLLDVAIITIDEKKGKLENELSNKKT